MRHKIPIILLIVAAVAAGVLWWRDWGPREPVLERGWAATVVAVAGDGIGGVGDGHADRARFSDPFGVAVAIDGSVYLTDGGLAQRIRRISSDGVVSSIAGGNPGFADGVGAAARFNTPSGVAIDANGTLYVADTGNNAIRRVTREGMVSTFAGDGVAGYRDGRGHQARFNGPVGVAIDVAGRVIVADTYNDRIRAIAPDGTVSTLAGSAEPGWVDGATADARFDTPCGVAVDPAGNIVVADTGNSVVRMIAPSGNVSTLTSTLAESLLRPIGIATSRVGEIYVTDDRGRVVEISAGGASRIVAGSEPGFRDGAGADARFRRPAGLALVAPGRLMVTDTDNALVRLVAARSQLQIRLPASPFIGPRFDPDVFARQPLLWPVAPLEGPHEIAGTLGEARGGEGTERFHAGIDVRVQEGTPVLAVRQAVVSSPIASADFGSLNESVRLGPLTYVHLRVGRGRGNDVMDAARFVPTHDETGKLIRVRVKRGARFSTGEVIGTVNAFNHVHLTVGWPGDEHNPLLFRLVQFKDTVPPTIARGGVRVYDEDAQPLTRRLKGRLVISGRVQVVVDAWDQVNGNRPSRRLGVYALGYQVLNRDGSPAPGFETARETIRFNRLALDPQAARLAYAPGSGIPFYGRRVTRFLYIVTNTVGDDAASQGFWDTAALPPGDYVLRVIATDIAGNEARSHRDVPVTIAPQVSQSSALPPVIDRPGRTPLTSAQRLSSKTMEAPTMLAVVAARNMRSDATRPTRPVTIIKPR